MIYVDLAKDNKILNIMEIYTIKQKALNDLYKKFGSLLIDKRIRPYLDKKMLKRIIEDLIYISNSTIEGRKIKTRFLILCNSKPFKEIDFGDYCFIEVPKENLEGLDYKKLKKYFETVSSDNEFVVFSPKKEGLTIVGLLYLGRKMRHYEEKSALQFRCDEYFEFSEILLQSLVISVNKNQITFTIGGDKFAEITKGDLQLFELPKNVSKIICEVIERSPVFSNVKEEQKIINDAKRETKSFLEQLVILIKNEGHGSIILFGNFNQIKEDMIHTGYIKTNITVGHYFIEYSEMINLGFNDMGMGSDGELHVDAYKHLIIRKKVALIKSLLGLSKTDGAMIFNRDLNLIGAGVFLRPKNTSEENLGGARLRSAKAFIKEQQGTLGIIISQDGKIHCVE